MQHIYHVGLIQRGNRAIFQFRNNVDLLDTETLEYFGRRETTIAKARQTLRTSRAAVLAKLQCDYPARQFTSVAIQ